MERNGGLDAQSETAKLANVIMVKFKRWPSMSAGPGAGLGLSREDYRQLSATVREWLLKSEHSIAVAAVQLALGGMRRPSPQPKLPATAAMRF